MDFEFSRPGMHRLGAAMTTLALFSGCAEPARTLRLEPLDPAVRWVSGQPWVQSEKEGVLVRLGYRDTAPGPVVFDLEIMNASATDLMFRPEASLLLEDRLGAKPVGAIDPEATLLALDEHRAEVEALEADSAGLNAVAGLFDLAAAFVNANEPRTAAEATRDQIAAQQAEANQRERDQAHERTLQDIDARRRETATTSMRRTTLAAGQSARGALRFPAPVGDGPFTVLVNAGSQQFRFRFQPRWQGGRKPAPRGWPRAAETGTTRP